MYLDAAVWLRTRFYSVGAATHFPAKAIGDEHDPCALAASFPIRGAATGCGRQLRQADGGPRMWSGEAGHKKKKKFLRVEVDENLERAPRIWEGEGPGGAISSSLDAL